MRERNKEKYELAFNLVKKGYTGKYIGNKLGVSKQRIYQLIMGRVDPVKLKQEINIKRLKNLSPDIKRDLKLGVSIKKVVEKYKIKRTDYPILLSFGADLRVFKKEDILKRRQLCYDLYNKGLTAYEILNSNPKLGLDNINGVYMEICKFNNGHLPKRESSRDKKAIKLDKEYQRL